MTEFEPWISSTRSDRSTNWATTRVTSYFSDMIKNNSIPEFGKFLIYLETFGQICGSQTYREKGLMERGGLNDVCRSHGEVYLPRRRYQPKSAQMSNEFENGSSIFNPFVLTFHKHNSLPLGPIQAFISS